MMASRLIQIPLLLSLVPIANSCLLDFEHTSFEPSSLGPQRRQNDDPNARPPFPDLSQFHLPIGTGDRFNNGQEAPVGFGRLSAQPPDIESVLSLAEIRSAADSLVTEFPDSVQIFEAPNPTHDNRTMYGLRIFGKSCAVRDPGAYGVFLTAGIHSRERSIPDGLMYFLSDLLHADREDEGLKYGEKSYTSAEVHRALSSGLVVLPVLNPDGVAHDQANNNCWRVNRNPNGGVDLNRNFDFLWDYETIFSPNIPFAPASKRPGDEDYRGPGVGSEPETKNVVWTLDEHPNLRWHMDMHTFAALVLYPWGDDVDQSTDPGMNLLNETFYGKHGHIVDPPDSIYEAYLDSDTLATLKNTADQMTDSMKLAGGVEITAIQSVQLYPTSGTAQDYIQARGLVDSTKRKVNSLTTEFGRFNPDLMERMQRGTLACPFYPNAEIYRENVLQVASGTMELLLSAAETGDNGCVVEAQGENRGASLSAAGKLSVWPKLWKVVVTSAGLLALI